MHDGILTVYTYNLHSVGCGKADYNIFMKQDE